MVTLHGNIIVVSRSLNAMMRWACGISLHALSGALSDCKYDMDTSMMCGGVERRDEVAVLLGSVCGRKLGNLLMYLVTEIINTETRGRVSEILHTT